MENDNIDLTKFEPIPYKNTIAVLNEYVLQNIDFLNKFGHFNENQLHEMEVAIDEIESKVSLLEKKLDSVAPELYQGLVLPAPGAPIVKPAPQQAAFDDNFAPNSAVPQEAPVFQEQQIQQQQPQQEVVPEQVQEEVIEEPPEVDERLQKYIKLHSYGVPLIQLKMKMQMEGVDPQLLEDYVATH